MKYCKDIDTILLTQLKKINLNYIWWIKSDIEYVLENIEDCPLSLKYLKDNFHIIISKYIDEIEESEGALKIPSFFNKFGYQFKEYSDYNVGQDKLIRLISRVVIAQEKDLMSSYKDNVETWEQYDDLIYDELNELKGNLLNELCPDISVEIPKHFENEELEIQLKNNKNNDQEAIKREKERDNYYKEVSLKSTMEFKKIDDLFYNNNNEEKVVANN